MKTYFGMYQGVVCNIKDPEKRGRIKVTCPKVLGEKIESAWCDPCIPVSYDGGGDICIPKIDETVWVMFIEGNPNKPVYMGSWWSKEKTPFGSEYKDIDTTRIIEYNTTKVTMKENLLLMEIGKEEKATIQMKDGIITIKDAKEAFAEFKEGNITLKDKVGATIEIKDGSITLKDNSGGIISISGGNINLN